MSNFLVEHLDELAVFADRMPAINQVELHPTFQQADVTAACRTYGIAVEAYSPLGQGADLGHPGVTAVADELGVTPAQVILRWHLDQGHVVIPKSVSRRRMRANASLEDVVLTPEHLAAIDALDTSRRIGGDPDGPSRSARSARRSGDPVAATTPQTSGSTRS